MTGKWIPSSRHLDGSRKTGAAGTTLVEVVAGLALLATLLTAVLLAKSRFSRQSRLADRRHEAVRAADALLCEWWRDLRRFPRSASGETPSGVSGPGDTEPGFEWRTQPVPEAGAEKLGGQVVRLELWDGPGEGDGAPRPLVRVDVLLPAGPAPGPALRAGAAAGQPAGGGQP